MKIKYNFSNGEHSEVEVDGVTATVIGSFEKAEHANEEKERYHREFSIDGTEYEGENISSLNYEPGGVIEREEFSKHINECLDMLTGTQRRRLLMLAEGLSMREIARIENKDIKTIRESIAAAKKSFLKNF